MIVESRPQERGRTNLPTEHLRQSPFKDAFDDQSEILSDEQAEAKSCLSKVICLHPEYDKAMAKIRKVIRCNMSSHAPEPSSILVLGQSGTGKTTLRDTIASMMQEPYETIENGYLVRKIPFFDSSVHTDATPTAMSNEILRHMGIGAVKSSGAVDRVRACLKLAGTFAFNYDEIHNLAGNQSANSICCARNWLRDLITNTGVMVIGYGTPNCKQMFLGEPQLLKRFPIILELNLFEFDVRPGSVFREVCEAFEDEIGGFGKLLRYNQPRMNESFLVAMYAASGGSINAIKKIYESAVNEAFLGDGRLDHEKFAIAVDDLTFHTSLSAPENAFRLDLRYLRTCIRNALLKRGY
jgi:energy-coupling factor transporter ATP-binding protein EcfA2